MTKPKRENTPAATRRTPARRYSAAEIRRNRIIAVVVLVVVVAILVFAVSSLVRCAAGVPGDAPQDGGGEGPGDVVAEQVGEAVAQELEANASAAAVAEGQGVDDPWVASGRFSTGDAELDQMVKGFCDSNSRADLNAADNAFNVYCYAVWAEFVERENNQHPTGPDWDKVYAKQALSGNGVNCFEQVAVAEYILKYFGYADAQAEPCFILRQSGEYGDHGLLYVTDLDGRKCLCDPAFGANGWMLDAGIYTVKVMDVGQDPSEFAIADFEEVVPAPWM